MERKKNELTTEDLKKKFTSQFELVNYAIRLAENMIKSGRGPRMKTDIQNRSLQILEEIATGRDEFDDIAVPAVVAEHSFQEAAKEAKATSSERKSERKGAHASKMQDHKRVSKAQRV